MRRPTRRGAAAWWPVTVLALVWTGATLALPAAPAAAVGACDGVLVVVEGRALGGGAARCASSPADGLSALRQAGFGVTLGTGRYAGGFVCAIDARPARGCDEVDADTYWSYWSMQPGTDKWVYSSFGAVSSHPKAGGIEAWVWQDGGAVEPPAPRSAVPPATAGGGATPPAAAPQAKAGSPSQPASTAPAPAGNPAAGPAAAAGGTPSAAAADVPATTETAAPATSSGAASEAETSSTSDPSLLAAAVRSGDGDAGSGPAAWTGAVGLLVAALIGADAFRRARARRRDAA